MTTTDGRRLSAETSHPKGHSRNPLTDGEVEAKFADCAHWAGLTDGADVKALLDDLPDRSSAAELARVVLG